MNTLSGTLRFNEMMAALKKHGYRITPQRVELLKLVSESKDHPSASQCYKKIRLRFPTISQATVYKTLATLKQIGQVFQVDLHNDSHYDGCHPEPHPHLVCTQCGHIADGDAALAANLLAGLQVGTGYTQLQPQITLYGLCPECQAEPQPTVFSNGANAPLNQLDADRT